MTTPSAADAFWLRCEALSLLVRDGAMDPVEAVDRLQTAAEGYGIEQLGGQDTVQQIITEAMENASAIKATLDAWDQPERKRAEAERKNGGSNTPSAPLGEWDAGDDVEPPPPRAWLLGNIFARTFLSSLFAEGGTGKTALRYAQYLSLAIGRSLTGEHVFQRCRVLIVSLEDDAKELRRRILAAMLRYQIKREDVAGWLFLAAPGSIGGKLMVADARGHLQRGALADKLEAVIAARKIDLVALDPFIKAHSVDENSNSAIDDVAQLLTDLAAKYDIAIDIPHHTRKGGADPGDADRAAGPAPQGTRAA
jgi:RecA-family ATPase